MFQAAGVNIASMCSQVHCLFWIIWVFFFVFNNFILMHGSVPACLLKAMITMCKCMYTSLGLQCVKDQLSWCPSYLITSSIWGMGADLCNQIGEQCVQQSPPTRKRRENNTFCCCWVVVFLQNGKNSMCLSFCCYCSWVGCRCRRTSMCGKGDIPPVG